MSFLIFSRLKNTLSRFFLSLLVVFALCSCTLFLLNGNLSFNYYESKSGTFKCKLPGGALNSKVEVTDRFNELGETATFSLSLGFLWRIDHLLIGKHKLAMINKIPVSLEDRRKQLDIAKEAYISNYLTKNTNKVEVNWEQFTAVDDAEVLLTNIFVSWDDKEEAREVLFSIDGDYLNVIHYSQNVSDELKTITSGAKGFYKSCEFL